MTAGSYGYGSMRATDADRENVRQILQDAHAQGRLSWDEFDSRSSALMNAQTYDQLAELTSDLPGRVPSMPSGGYPQYQQYQPVPFSGQQTNGLAIAALVCGICQVFFWFLTGVPAVVLGHIARRQIRQTGEAGDGMALAGLILGYAGLALTALFVIIFVAVATTVARHGGFVPPQPPLPSP